MNENTANAYEMAQVAAERAGVSVRLATRADFDALLNLFEATWGARRIPDQSLAQTIGYSGDTVIVATDDDVVVGGVFGFLGWDEGPHVHSYMAAVRRDRVSLGIGRAMKLFQRATCLDLGIGEIRWLYDPLIQRNAHLNLVRLGAEVSRYLPNFFGVLGDDISGSDPTDQFEVRWKLDSQRVRRALAGIRPQPAADSGDTFPLLRHYERLRREQPSEAAQLRARSATVFADRFAAGLRPDLNQAGDYVFVAPDGAAVTSA